MKAHKKVIAEQKLKEPNNLFGAWWEQEKWDLNGSVVKPVSYETAKSLITEFEWMKSMPAISLHQYGIFFGLNCGGVVVYSPEYCENLGSWDKYGYTGKIILLSRGACLPWTPKNTASRLIRQSMKLLPEQYEVVTATVDPMAGEIGTIYQACGFHFVGTMHEVDPHRPGIRYQGRTISGRTLRHWAGHYRKEDLKKQFPGAEFVPQVTKGRYFSFRGKAISERFKAIAGLVKPYPKRSDMESRGVA